MSTIKSNEVVINNFKIPSWASKPPAGLHLDVTKDGKLIQKLMIDEKNNYFFGRNRQQCDFPIDHHSCSRVHAVLLWHRFMQRAFLIDLGSVHGSYVGKIRLEAHKPQQIPVDSELHFGASTRIYILRERPNPLFNESSTDANENSTTIGPENRLTSDSNVTGTGDSLLYSQLPQSEVELDNLTEFNTAHNRRISSIVDVAPKTSLLLSNLGKRKFHSVQFSDADEVINPEDVDPSIGRFRNLIQETFIPNNRVKGSHEGAILGVAAPDSSFESAVIHRPGDTRTSATGIKQPLPTASPVGLLDGSASLANRLGLPMPNLAPDVEESEGFEPKLPPTLAMLHAHAHSRPSAVAAQSAALLPADILGEAESSSGSASGLVGGIGGTGETPKRRKYVKESWPGKRPGFLIGPTV